jgi:hypothetical protein
VSSRSGKRGFPAQIPVSQSASKRGGVIMPVRPGGQTETPNDSLARGLDLTQGSWRRIYSLQSGRVFRACVI